MKKFTVLFVLIALPCLLSACETVGTQSRTIEPYTGNFDIEGGYRRR